ncbi:MAG: flagellar hook-length control protein FliK [Spirochaetota bacterium]|nr:MAG: flagellar hook-length control protein FliK [Spirochaetota bacterium]
MIEVLPGNIESAMGVNPKDVIPKSASVKKTDRQKEFVAELEHFLGQVNHDQKTSTKHLSNDRISNRETHLKSRKSHKSLTDTLFPKILHGQRTVRDLRFLNIMKRLHGNGVKTLDMQMRKKVKVSYMKKRSAFSLRQIEKGKQPYLKLLKHLDNIKAGQPKKQKIMDRRRGDLGLEDKGRRNSRIIKGKKWLILKRKQGEHHNLDQKSVTRVSADSSKKGGVKDLTLVATRYESNVPTRVETGPQIQALHYTNRNSEDMFSEIVKQFTLIVNKGGGEARIVLEPQNLGNIKLNVKLHHSEVNTHIVVDNMTLKDLIQSKLTVLQDSLLSQGFTLGSFSVEVKEQNSSSQMTADGKNRGVGVKQREESIEADQQVAHIADLPWLSTVVNITV